MAVKFLLCIAILAFTSGVGYFLASKYRQRKVFFTQFYEFNERFLREISYSKRPIREFIVSNAYKGDFSELLKNYLSVLGKEDELLNIFSEISYINQEEIKTAIDYFRSLGKGDSESQKNYFSNAKELIGEYKKKSETEYKKYADLYVKLGVLIGLAIIIIII